MELPVRTLSYKTDIVGWLEACRNAAATRPLVRETLTQYLHLLKELTGQSADRLLMDEIKQLLLDKPEYLASAELLGRAYTEARTAVGKQINAALDTALDTLIRTLPDTHHPGTVLQFDGYSICLTRGSDEESYYWGFSAINNQGIDDHQCMQPRFKVLADELEAFDPGFKRSRSERLIGWISPPGYTHINRHSAERVAELASEKAQQMLAVDTTSRAQQCVARLRTQFDAQQLSQPPVGP